MSTEGNALMSWGYGLAGLAHALALREAGHIHACAITCQGWMVMTERPGQAPVFLESAAPQVPRKAALALRCKRRDRTASAPWPWASVPMRSG